MKFLIEVDVVEVFNGMVNEFFLEFEIEFFSSGLIFFGNIILLKKMDVEKSILRIENFLCEKIWIFYKDRMLEYDNLGGYMSFVFDGNEYKLYVYSWERKKLLYVFVLYEVMKKIKDELLIKVWFYKKNGNGCI